MPSVWVWKSDYKVLMRIKTSLEKKHKRDVGMPEVISYLLAATTIPSISLEKDEEIIRKLEKLTSITKKRMERGSRSRVVK